MSQNPSSSSSTSTVYINPRFKNVHINPKFIQAPVRPNKIHINPNFIAKNAENGNCPSVDLESREAAKANLEKPLFCTRNKLIRSRMPPEPSIATVHVPGPTTSLKKIGLRKLVRRSPIVNSVQLPFDQRPKLVASRFRLKRASFSDVLSPKKIISSKYRLRRIGSSSIKKDPNTLSGTSQLCDINGVFYKSARSELFKSPVEGKVPGKSLIIRGERFLVTGNGNRLQRAPVTDSSSEKGSIKPPQIRKRIDIGGLTYVVGNKGTFERTNSHIVRNYLSHAKQRSLQILSSAGQFKKNNVPCMIYRRLGKCRSHERGKCNKVHNPQQIAVCSKFLRGLCTNAECLLSHKVSLTKMPVCRFFLGGCCTTANCPYLHKKVSDTAEICVDFQRGFCPMADKCSKRHVYEVAPKRNKKLANVQKPQTTMEVDDEAVDSRYYSKEQPPKDSKSSSTNSGELIIADAKESEDVVMDEELENDDSEIVPKPRRRPPIGTLPAFIPL